MEFLDARRLTGPNLLGNQPGAILDILCGPDEIPRISDIWERSIRAALGTLGWPVGTFHVHPLNGGVSLYFTAPINRLYAASAMNEWAWLAIVADQKGDRPPPLNIAEIETALADETDSRVIELQDLARDNAVPFLWDDDEVSFGFGAASTTWSTDSLPDPATINCSDFHDLPISIVTGTNGKTTVTRLAKFILQNSGRQVGVSCTDWIAVNDTIIDRGDWSGPGGARAVLRNPDIDCAVLETARGGLLRRGLGVEHAITAVITNIAEDHLGDFGSRNLEELLSIKWIVSRAVESTGTLILNADDSLLVEASRNYKGSLVWFSLSESNSKVTSHLADGGTAFVYEQDSLVLLEGNSRALICLGSNIPITMGGAAKHNIANALSAAALTHSMGVSLADIANGLTKMTQAQNPGRCNIYTIGDSVGDSGEKNVQVLVDFAHNPHAMQALFDMARAIPAKRRLLAFGQAGDRTDDQIRELTAAAWRIGLDRVLVSELATYHRGRQAGEVFTIIRDKLLDLGADQQAIEHFESELEALESALQWAMPGDLVIMLALSERVAILDRLA